MNQPVCEHYNGQYGHCLLPRDHAPIDNGGGVFYKHMYKMQGSRGNLDVREAMSKSEAGVYQARHATDESQ